jgi:uncharacterized membrane protein YcaP (DUF421 family)
MIELFEVRMPVAELVIRGSAIFWFLFLIFRFVMRRDVGALGVADVLLLVIIADASQNAMAGNYTTISEGFILIATIIGWNWLFDWLAYRSHTMRKFVSPRRLLLVDHGRALPGNLKKQYVTMEELTAKLRLQGVDDLAEVKKAYLESDGEVSVIRCEPGHAAAGRPGKAARSNGPVA